jgi:4-amino-4-deoxy-L-arabinose transferase-like glycosyltransferase
VTATTPTWDDRTWRRVGAGLLAAVTVVMFATVLDYSMSGDEGVQHRYGLKLVRYIATRGTDPSAMPIGDITYYGGFFEMLGEWAAQLSPLDVFETRHAVTVVFALAAYAATWRMAASVGGEAAGTLALLFLALTPPFYGHAFNNPKDIPFAGTFALGAWAILAARRGDGEPGWRRLMVAGLAVGLAAGVRVAGLVLLGCAAVLWTGRVVLEERERRTRALVELALSLAAVAVIAWLVMLAFWPPAWSDPLRHPLRAWGTFASFWRDSVLLFGGREVVFGDVARVYLPTWFALTMPETYFLAFAVGLVPLAGLARRLRSLDVRARARVWEGVWVLMLAVGPVAWAVVRETPLYDGLRHFLFVMPFLAVLAGLGVAAYWRGARGSRHAGLAAAVLALAAGVVAVDMVRLHPYQALYFNRSVGGGLRHAVSQYETDYWCLTFQDGTAWLMDRFRGATCREKIRVAGHSTQLQTSYYLQKTEEGRRIFKAVGVGDAPHYVMATTRFGDHENTPGRVVHTVGRQGATLMWLFEVQPPDCDVPEAATVAPAPRPSGPARRDAAKGGK